MDEFSSFNAQRLAQVNRIVEAMYDSLVKKVIADIKAMPENCRQSPGDSGLADVWEEFKYQVQRDRSFFFEFYETTIRAICASVVAALDRERQGLLWLWSEAYFERDLDESEIPYGSPVHEALENELYNRVYSVADGEELAFDPDAASAQENFDEEMRLMWPENESDEDKPTSETADG